MDMNKTGEDFPTKFKHGQKWSHNTPKRLSPKDAYPKMLSFPNNGMNQDRIRNSILCTQRSLGVDHQKEFSTGNVDFGNGIVEAPWNNQESTTQSDPSKWEAMEVRYVDYGGENSQFYFATDKAHVDDEVQQNLQHRLRKQTVTVEKVVISNLLDTNREICGPIGTSRQSEYRPRAIDADGHYSNSNQTRSPNVMTMNEGLMEIVNPNQHYISPKHECCSTRQTIVSPHLNCNNDIFKTKLCALSKDEIDEYRKTALEILLERARSKDKEMDTSKQDEHFCLSAKHVQYKHIKVLSPHKMSSPPKGHRTRSAGCERRKDEMLSKARQQIMKHRERMERAKQTSVSLPLRKFKTKHPNVKAKVVHTPLRKSSLASAGCYSAKSRESYNCHTSLSETKLVNESPLSASPRLSRKDERCLLQVIRGQNKKQPQQYDTHLIQSILRSPTAKAVQALCWFYQQADNRNFKKHLMDESNVSVQDILEAYQKLFFGTNDETQNDCSTGRDASPLESRPIESKRKTISPPSVSPADSIDSVASHKQNTSKIDCTFLSPALEESAQHFNRSRSKSLRGSPNTSMRTSQSASAMSSFSSDNKFSTFPLYRQKCYSHIRKQQPKKILKTSSNQDNKKSPTIKSQIQPFYCRHTRKKRTSKFRGKSTPYISQMRYNLVKPSKAVITDKMKKYIEKPAQGKSAPMIKTVENKKKLSPQVRMKRTASLPTRYHLTGKASRLAAPKARKDVKVPAVKSAPPNVKNERISQGRPQKHKCKGKRPTGITGIDSNVEALTSAKIKLPLSGPGPLIPMNGNSPPESSDRRKCKKKVAALQSRDDVNVDVSKTSSTIHGNDKSFSDRFEQCEILEIPSRDETDGQVKLAALKLGKGIKFDKTALPVHENQKIPTIWIEKVKCKNKTSKEITDGNSIVAALKSGEDMKCNVLDIASSSCENTKSSTEQFDPRKESKIPMGESSKSQSLMKHSSVDTTTQSEKSSSKQNVVGSTTKDTKELSAAASSIAFPNTRKPFATHSDSDIVKHNAWARRISRQVQANTKSQISLSADDFHRNTTNAFKRQNVSLRKTIRSENAVVKHNRQCNLIESVQREERKLPGSSRTSYLDDVSWDLPTTSWSQIVPREMCVNEYMNDIHHEDCGKAHTRHVPSENNLKQISSTEHSFRPVNTPKSGTISHLIQSFDTYAKENKSRNEEIVPKIEKRNQHEMITTSSIVESTGLTSECISNKSFDQCLKENKSLNEEKDKKIETLNSWEMMKTSTIAESTGLKSKCISNKDSFKNDECETFSAKPTPIDSLITHNSQCKNQTRIRGLESSRDEGFLSVSDSSSSSTSKYWTKSGDIARDKWTALPGSKFTSGEDNRTNLGSGAISSNMDKNIYNKHKCDKSESDSFSGINPKPEHLESDSKSELPTPCDLNRADVFDTWPQTVIDNMASISVTSEQTALRNQNDRKETDMSNDSTCACSNVLSNRDKNVCSGEPKKTNGVKSSESLSCTSRFIEAQLDSNQGLSLSVNDKKDLDTFLTDENLYWTSPEDFKKAINCSKARKIYLSKNLHRAYSHADCATESKRNKTITVSREVANETTLQYNAEEQYFTPENNAEMCNKLSEKNELGFIQDENKTEDPGKDLDLSKVVISNDTNKSTNKKITEHEVQSITEYYNYSKTSNPYGNEIKETEISSSRSAEENEDEKERNPIENEYIPKPGAIKTIPALVELSRNYGECASDSFDDKEKSETVSSVTFRERTVRNVVNYFSKVCANLSEDDFTSSILRKYQSSKNIENVLHDTVQTKSDSILRDDSIKQNNNDNPSLDLSHDHSSITENEASISFSDSASSINDRVAKTTPDIVDGLASIKANYSPQPHKHNTLDYMSIQTPQKHSSPDYGNTEIPQKHKSPEYKSTEIPQKHNSPDNSKILPKQNSPKTKMTNTIKASNQDAILQQSDLDTQSNYIGHSFDNLKCLTVTATSDDHDPKNTIQEELEEKDVNQKIKRDRNPAFAMMFLKNDFKENWLQKGDYSEESPYDFSQLSPGASTRKKNFELSNSINQMQGSESFSSGDLCKARSEVLCMNSSCHRSCIGQPASKRLLDCSQQAGDEDDIQQIEYTIIRSVDNPGMHNGGEICSQHALFNADQDGAEEEFITMQKRENTENRLTHIQQKVTNLQSNENIISSPNANLSPEVQANISNSYIISEGFNGRTTCAENYIMPDICDCTNLGDDEIVLLCHSDIIPPPVEFRTADDLLDAVDDQEFQEIFINNNKMLAEILLSDDGISPVEAVESVQEYQIKTDDLCHNDRVYNEVSIEKFNDIDGFNETLGDNLMMQAKEYEDKSEVNILIGLNEERKIVHTDEGFDRNVLDDTCTDGYLSGEQKHDGVMEMSVNDYQNDQIGVSDDVERTSDRINPSADSSEDILKSKANIETGFIDMCDDGSVTVNKQTYEKQNDDEADIRIGCAEMKIKNEENFQRFQTAEENVESSIGIGNANNMIIENTRKSEDGEEMCQICDAEVATTDACVKTRCDSASVESCHGSSSMHDSENRVRRYQGVHLAIQNCRHDEATDKPLTGETCMAVQERETLENINTPVTGCCELVQDVHGESIKNSQSIQSTNDQIKDNPRTDGDVDVLEEVEERDEPGIVANDEMIDLEQLHHQNSCSSASLSSHPLKPVDTNKAYRYANSISLSCEQRPRFMSFYNPNSRPFQSPPCIPYRFELDMRTPSEFQNYDWCDTPFREIKSTTGDDSIVATSHQFDTDADYTLQGVDCQKAPSCSQNRVTSHQYDSYVSSALDAEENKNPVELDTDFEMDIPETLVSHSDCNDSRVQTIRPTSKKCDEVITIETFRPHSETKPIEEFSFAQIATHVFEYAEEKSRHYSQTKANEELSFAQLPTDVFEDDPTIKTRCSQTHCQIDSKECKKKSVADDTVKAFLKLFSYRFMASMVATYQTKDQRRAFQFEDTADSSKQYSCGEKFLKSTCDPKLSMDDIQNDLEFRLTSSNLESALSSGASSSRSDSISAKLDELRDFLEPKVHTPDMNIIGLDITSCNLEDHDAPRDGTVECVDVMNDIKLNLTNDSSPMYTESGHEIEHGIPNQTSDENKEEKPSTLFEHILNTMAFDIQSYFDHLKKVAVAEHVPRGNHGCFREPLYFSRESPPAQRKIRKSSDRNGQSWNFVPSAAGCNLRRENVYPTREETPASPPLSLYFLSDEQLTLNKIAQPGPLPGTQFPYLPGQIFVSSVNRFIIDNTVDCNPGPMCNIPGFLIPTPRVFCGDLVYKANDRVRQISKDNTPQTIKENILSDDISQKNKTDMMEEHELDTFNELGSFTTEMQNSSSVRVSKSSTSDESINQADELESEFDTDVSWHADGYKINRKSRKDYGMKKRPRYSLDPQYSRRGHTSKYNSPCLNSVSHKNSFCQSMGTQEFKIYHTRKRHLSASDQEIDEADIQQKVQSIISMSLLKFMADVLMLTKVSGNGPKIVECASRSPKDKALGRIRSSSFHTIEDTRVKQTKQLPRAFSNESLISLQGYKMPSDASTLSKQSVKVEQDAMRVSEDDKKNVNYSKQISQESIMHQRTEEWLDTPSDLIRNERKRETFPSDEEVSAKASATSTVARPGADSKFINLYTNEVENVTENNKVKMSQNENDTLPENPHYDSNKNEHVQQDGTSNINDGSYICPTHVLVDVTRVDSVANCGFLKSSHDCSQKYERETILNLLKAETDKSPNGSSVPTGNSFKTYFKHTLSFPTREENTSSNYDPSFLCGEERKEYEGLDFQAADNPDCKSHNLIARYGETQEQSSSIRRKCPFKSSIHPSSPRDLPKRHSSSSGCAKKATPSLERAQRGDNEYSCCKEATRNENLLRKHASSGAIWVGEKVYDSHITRLGEIRSDMHAKFEDVFDSNTLSNTAPPFVDRANKVVQEKWDGTIKTSSVVDCKNRTFINELISRFDSGSQVDAYDRELAETNEIVKSNRKGQSEPQTEHRNNSTLSSFLENIHCKEGWNKLCSVGAVGWCNKKAQEQISPGVSVDHHTRSQSTRPSETLISTRPSDIVASMKTVAPVASTRKSGIVVSKKTPETVASIKNYKYGKDDQPRGNVGNKSASANLPSLEEKMETSAYREEGNKESVNDPFQNRDFDLASKVRGKSEVLNDSGCTNTSVGNVLWKQLEPSSRDSQVCASRINPGHDIKLQNEPNYKHNIDKVNWTSMNIESSKQKVEIDNGTSETDSLCGVRKSTVATKMIQKFETQYTGDERDSRHIVRRANTEVDCFPGCANNETPKLSERELFAEGSVKNQAYVHQGKYDQDAKRKLGSSSVSSLNNHNDLLRRSRYSVREKEYGETLVKATECHEEDDFERETESKTNVIKIDAILNDGSSQRKWESSQEPPSTSSTGLKADQVSHRKPIVGDDIIKHAPSPYYPVKNDPLALDIVERVTRLYGNSPRVNKLLKQLNCDALASCVNEQLKEMPLLETNTSLSNVGTIKKDESLSRAVKQCVNATQSLANELPVHHPEDFGTTTALSMEDNNQCPRVDVETGATTLTPQKNTQISNDADCCSEHKITNEAPFLPARQPSFPATQSQQSCDSLQPDTCKQESNPQDHGTQSQQSCDSSQLGACKQESNPQGRSNISTINNPTLCNTQTENGFSNLCENLQIHLDKHLDFDETCNMLLSSQNKQFHHEIIDNKCSLPKCGHGSVPQCRDSALALVTQHPEYVHEHYNNTLLVTGTEDGTRNEMKIHDKICQEEKQEDLKESIHSFHDRANATVIISEENVEKSSESDRTYTLPTKDTCPLIQGESNDFHNHRTLGPVSSTTLAEKAESINIDKPSSSLCQEDVIPLEIYSKEISSSKQNERSSPFVVTEQSTVEFPKREDIKTVEKETHPYFEPDAIHAIAGNFKSPERVTNYDSIGWTDTREETVQHSEECDHIRTQQDAVLTISNQDTKKGPNTKTNVLPLRENVDGDVCSQRDITLPGGKEKGSINDQHLNDPLPVTYNLNSVSPCRNQTQSLVSGESLPLSTENKSPEHSKGDLSLSSGKRAELKQANKACEILDSITDSNVSRRSNKSSRSKKNKVLISFPVEIKTGSPHQIVEDFKKSKAKPSQIPIDVYKFYPKGKGTLNAKVKTLSISGPLMNMNVPVYRHGLDDSGFDGAKNGTKAPVNESLHRRCGKQGAQLKQDIAMGENHFLDHENKSRWKGVMKKFVPFGKKKT